MAGSYFGDDKNYITCLTPIVLKQRVVSAPTPQIALKCLLDQLKSFGYKDAVDAYYNWPALHHEYMNTIKEDVQNERS